MDYDSYKLALQASRLCIDLLESNLISALHTKIKEDHPLYHQKFKMENDIKVGIKCLRHITKSQLHHIFRISQALEKPEHYASIR